MAPAFSAATAQLEPALRLAKLNKEVEQGLAQRFGIQSIPTLMIIHKGREIARQSGAMPPAASSEERRVRKEGVSTCRSRWSPYTENKNQKIAKTKKMR